jgi:hypothetical protein
MMASCQKKASWDTKVLAPIIQSRLDVGDIFGDTNVAVNPDQSWSVVVQQKIDMLQTDNVVNLDDTVSKDIFTLPFTFTIPPGQKVIEKQNVTPLNFNGMELKLARASVAKMKFYVTNSIKQKLLVKYTLHSATLNGVVYEVEEDVPAATDTSKAYVVKTIDLDKYDIDLTGPNSDNYNEIYATTTVWVHPDGDTAIVTPTDSLIIISTFDEFKPEYAKGYIGSDNFHEMGASALNVFDDFKSGSFDLQSVKAVLYVNNFVGADISMTVNDLATKNNSTNTSISLNHSIIGSAINVSRAAESNNPQYPVYPNILTYDLSNSNVDNMIEVMPDSLVYDVTAELNPLGNVGAGTDFIYFDKGLQANLNLEIPLNFSSDNLLIEDYSNFNFNSENVNSGFINIYLENEFPFSVNIQFYLLDEQDNIFDSLLVSNVLVAPGLIDANGIVSASTSTNLQIKLDDYRISTLKRSHKMLIKAIINSDNNQAYKLYENYGMDIKMVGDLSYGI